MKKKYLFGMLTMLMVAFANLCFTACGDGDDEEEQGGGGSQSVLVGSWYTSWDKETSSAGTSGYETWTFKNDGTGSYSGSNQDYDRYGNKNGSPYTWNESFRYEYVYDTYLKTGTFMIRYSGSSTYSTETFELNGDKLTMRGATYIKR